MLVTTQYTANAAATGRRAIPKTNASPANRLKAMAGQINQTGQLIPESSD